MWDGLGPSVKRGQRLWSLQACKVSEDLAARWLRVSSLLLILGTQTSCSAEAEGPSGCISTDGLYCSVASKFKKKKGPEMLDHPRFTDRETGGPRNWTTMGRS